MRRAAPLVLAALAAAVAGCGTPSPDVFIVNREGTVPGAKLRLRVIDSGDVECNGVTHRMPSKLLVDARALADDLNDVAKTGPSSLGVPSNSVMQYSIRVEEGNLHFADASKGQPKAFYEAALMVRRIARGPCGLAR